MKFITAMIIITRNSGHVFQTIICVFFSVKFAVNMDRIKRTRWETLSHVGCFRDADWLKWYFKMAASEWKFLAKLFATISSRVLSSRHNVIVHTCAPVILVARVMS